MSKRKSEEYPRTSSKRSAQISPAEQWRELLHRSRETLARGDYELAIDEASAAVSELLRSCLVPILDIRAMAHAKGSYFMEGLNDARRMIRYAPESTEGYLRVGALYMMQGKPWKALQVYEDGLGIVPITHPKYQQLVDAIQEAKKQDEKRIDVIAALPNEVLTSIFIRLPIETLAVCMNVSTQWRERLARCSEAWRNIEKVNSEISTTIPFVASHVRHLQLLCSDITVEQRIIRLLKKGAFRRLQTLKVFTDKKKLEYIYNTQLPAVLVQTQNTLRRLELDCPQTSVIQLTTLLSLCPHLTDLSYRTTDTAFFPTVTSFTPTSDHVLPDRLNLINLCLWSQQIHPTELELILCRCPSLRGLVVHKNFMEVALLSSDRICTELETLYINRLMPLATLIDCHQGVFYPPGMRRFSMCYGDRVEFGAIIPLLRRNSKTLQEFRLELSDYAPDVLRQWHPFSNIVFSRLHTLHCGIGRCTADTVAEMIHQCPALEKFTIVTTSPALHLFSDMRKGNYRRCACLACKDSEPQGYINQ
ncbi:hypothetical protein BX666DRAFT_1977160 [Dichotomocladium elegans]|nr:hypothetical protein BX666DRAFT_1977160 [Dichotomocladium elegans]